MRSWAARAEEGQPRKRGSEELADAACPCADTRRPGRAKGSDLGPLWNLGRKIPR